MKCEKCGWDDKGTGDFAHVCGPVEVKKQSVMNERIREIAEQATQKFSRFGEKDSWENLFAELIVSSVLDEVEERAYYSGDRAWSDELDRQWVELEFGFGKLAKAKKNAGS